MVVIRGSHGGLEVGSRGLGMILWTLKGMNMFLFLHCYGAFVQGARYFSRESFERSCQI